MPLKYHIMLLSLISTYLISGIDTCFLIKIPTRSRPDQFFKNLDTYYKKLSRQIDYHFVISLDRDDKTMNNQKVIKRLQKYKNLSFHFGNNHSKIEAYNADIENYKFDLLLVASDDAIPVLQDYDLVLYALMIKAFPDFDGVINFNDGNVGKELNTLPVLGYTFYHRFNYIYHPSYRSLFCDNELTEISQVYGRELYIDTVILRHNHPVWQLGKIDSLYQHNDRSSAIDEQTWLHRKANNYFLPSTLLHISKKNHVVNTAALYILKQYDCFYQQISTCHSIKGSHV